MGSIMYWLIVAAVVILGVIMPQHGHRRKRYVIIMAGLHAFVSGFRYMFLTGDLIRYNTGFHEARSYGYFSEAVFNEGINAGFLWFRKFVADLTNGDFQFFLLVIAVTIEFALLVLVLNYSPRPWISYLVWNCIGFYIFGFSAVKQSLAMAFVMVAMVGVLENRFVLFLVFSLLAGFIHFPAFAFLPAYWIAKVKIAPVTMLGYAGAAALIFLFQNPIVAFVTSLYYEEGEFMFADEAALGGRFYMMVVILIMGALLKGFSDRKFEKVFNVMVVASIFQMFSGYNNVFTRFADYYFQFSVLFLPMMVSSFKVDSQIGGSNTSAILRFNKRSLNLIALAMAAFLIWYYDYTCLSQSIAYEVDNYLNFRFMWDV